MLFTDEMGGGTSQTENSSQHKYHEGANDGGKQDEEWSICKTFVVWAFPCYSLGKFAMCAAWHLNSIAALGISSACLPAVL